MSSKRVLVTGGAGFVGANLVRMLLARDYEVTVLDDLSTGIAEYIRNLPVELVEGDIVNGDFVRRAVSQHSHVVHLAAQTGVPGSLRDPAKDCRVNVVGTLNVLESCRLSGAARIVFASSNAPLGRQTPPASEEKAPLPISPYGASKLSGEAYCLAYHGSWGLGTIVVRFANAYGPFSAHKNSVIAKFFKDILSHGFITVDGDGGQTRDFVHVDDLCRAVVLGLESDVAGEVFQVATGVETSVRDLALIIQDVVGRDVGVRHGPSRQADIRRNYSSIQKISRVLGWRPQTDLRTGLQKTWEWFAAR